MSALLDKLQKAGSITTASVLSHSAFFNARDIITTEIPIINIAFSALPDGGVVPGLTRLAGESKSFKTLMMLICMKAYLDKYPEAIALLYDSEFGITPQYLKNNGIDTDRVLHIPIEHIEQLKFDMTKRLKEIEKGDKVFVAIDSIGALASKKEVEDAEDEKSVADMTRAKALKSFFRIVTPHFTMKDIPCITIDHVYKELGIYPKTIVGGGSGGTYSANQTFIITKSQEKEGTELKGWQFTINIDKSRFVREKSKFTFTVLYGGGIQKYSGLFDLALEVGFIKRPTVKTYSIPTLFDDKTFYKKEIEYNAEIWDKLLKNVDFKEAIYNRYSYTVAEIMELEEEDFDRDNDSIESD